MTGCTGPALALLGLVCARAAVAAEALEPAEVTGFWAGDAEHAGERRRIALELAETAGERVARISIPCIGMRDVPVGPWRTEAGQVVVGRSFTLTLRDGRLEGVLPEALVPAKRIPVSLARASGPDPAPARPATRHPRPAIAWKAELGAPVWAGLAHDAARALVLAATDAGSVVALSERTGRVFWSARADGPIRARPTVDGGRVYVATDAGTVLALDVATGRRIWRAAVGTAAAPRAQAGTSEDRYERYASSVAVARGRAYVGGRDGKLRALDARSGRVLWEASAGDVIAGTPAVVGGLVVFGSFDGHVRAVGAADGGPRWDVDTGGAIASDVVSAGRKVLVGTRAYELLALDASTGARAWGRYVWFSWVESPPSIRDGVAYHGSSDALRAFAVSVDDGRLVWEREVPGWSWAQPAVDARSVVVATLGSAGSFAPREGALLALDRASGEVRWSLPSEQGDAAEWGFASAPLLVGERAFAADLRGTVFALQVR